MTADLEGDRASLAARLELQSRLLDLLRRDLDAAREAAEWKDRSNQETWRRARLFEMLLEQSEREWRRTCEEQKRLHEEERARVQKDREEERARFQKDREQERARLSGELEHLRSTLSWRITAPLRRLPIRQAPVAHSPAASSPTESPTTPVSAPPVPVSAPSPRSAAPVPSFQRTPTDLMDQAVRHLAEKGFRPRVVLDIGAAHGAWSQKAAALFPEAAFYLFEPLEENELALQTMSARDPRFHYLLTALGQVRGTLTINVTRDLDGSSLLKFPGQEFVGFPRQVPVETLDDLMASGRVPRPDLVKIDVQGFELQVLAGAGALFGTGCAFIIEASLFEFMPGCPLVHEVVSYFEGRGYRLFDVAGLLRRPYQNDLGQMDLVFVPRDSPLVASAQWV